MARGLGVLGEFGWETVANKLFRAIRLRPAGKACGATGTAPGHVQVLWGVRVAGDIGDVVPPVPRRAFTAYHFPPLEIAATAQ
jgi:hypothetical protein